MRVNLNLVGAGILISFLETSCATYHSADHEKTIIFYADGKPFTREALPGDLQQKIFKAEQNLFNTSLDATKNFLLSEKIAKESQSQSPSPAYLEWQNAEKSPISDDELKSFYEKNKKDFPYSFDLAKKEMEKLIRASRKEKAEVSLIKEIKIERNVKINIQAPDAPQLKIDTTGYPSKGDPNAKVQLIEFGDLACPHCQEASVYLKPILEKHQKDVQYFFMNFMLYPDNVSLTLAKAGICADRQKKFWDYHDLVFSDQLTMIFLEPLVQVKKIVDEKKLNLEEFKNCLADSSVVDLAKSHHEQAVKLGIQKTPTFFINGRMISEGVSKEILERAIAEAVNDQH